MKTPFLQWSTREGASCSVDILLQDGVLYFTKEMTSSGNNAMQKIIEETSQDISWEVKAFL